MQDDHKRPLPTATPLEVEVDAFITAVAHWCYPSDMEQRVAAEQCSRLANVNIVESLASTMETSGCSATVARWMLCAKYMDRILVLLKAGHGPREGVLTSGKAADALGYDPDGYGDWDGSMDAIDGP